MIYASSTMGSDFGRELVLVHGSVSPSIVKLNAAIPLEIRIENRLPVPIQFASNSLTPTIGNDETFNVSLVGIYRNTLEKGTLSVISRPRYEIPHATKVHEIKSGHTLIIQTDASKWKIDGGWSTGHYHISVRIEGLHVGWSVNISALSDLIEFEIR